MLGDIAIWRTNTAAEAQHALHFVCVCMGGGDILVEVFYSGVPRCIQHIV